MELKQRKCNQALRSPDDISQPKIGQAECKWRKTKSPEGPIEPM